jgi:hypothetical protein
MRFKFATWNINRRKPSTLDNDPRLNLLRSYKPDILALQEVSPSFYKFLASTDLFNWSAYSLKPGTTRSNGYALFGNNTFSLINQSLIDIVPFPEQTLICYLQSPTVQLTACSFHVPNGSNHGIRHGDKKRIFGRGIADWLIGQNSRTIFGIDANSPKVDHIDIGKCQLFRSDDHDLLGYKVDPCHNLKDALRTHLCSHTELTYSSININPDGPLAVSYEKGNNKVQVARRYDHIYITPDIKVIDVEYATLVYEASDHALAVAELDLTI